jgi:hypothetical protein
MTEFTDTFSKRNDSDNGPTRGQTIPHRQPSYDFQQGRGNEQSTEDEGMGGTTGGERIRESSEEESKDSVLTYNPNITPNKKKPRLPLNVLDKFDKKNKFSHFKTEKKRKYHSKITKEKQKHLKWKGKYKTEKSNFQNFKGQTQEQINENPQIQYVDGFGRLLKN